MACVHHGTMIPAPGQRVLDGGNMRFLAPLPFCRQLPFPNHFNLRWLEPKKSYKLKMINHESYILKYLSFSNENCMCLSYIDTDHLALWGRK